MRSEPKAVGSSSLPVLRTGPFHFHRRQGLKSEEISGTTSATSMHFGIFGWLVCLTQVARDFSQFAPCALKMDIVDSLHGARGVNAAAQQAQDAATVSSIP